MKDERPFDPRLAPLIALRRLMPLPGHDKEERGEQHELRKMELREQVRER